MSRDTLKMLKKVMIGDTAITFIILIVSILFFKTYTAAAVAGIIVAFVNFILNAVITNYTMRRSGMAILVVLGALARVAIAGAFAMVMYRGNMYNFAAYLIGYSLHYISIIISAAVRVHQ